MRIIIIMEREKSGDRKSFIISYLTSPAFIRSPGYLYRTPFHFHPQTYSTLYFVPIIGHHYFQLPVYNIGYIYSVLATEN